MGSHDLRGLSASDQARVAASADAGLLIGKGVSLTYLLANVANSTSISDTINSSSGGIAMVRARNMPPQIGYYLYKINHAASASTLSADAIKLRTDFLSKPLGATNLDAAIKAAQGDPDFQGAIAAKLGWEFPDTMDAQGAPVDFIKVAKGTTGADFSAVLEPMSTANEGDPRSVKHQWLYGDLAASQPQTADLLNKASYSFLQNLVGGADKGTKMNPQNISLQNWTDALTAAKNNGLGAAVVQSYFAAADAAGHDKIGFAKSFAAALAEVNKGTDLNSVAIRTYPPLTFSSGPVPAAVKQGLKDTTSSLAQMTGNWTTQQAAEAFLGLQQLHTTYSGFGSVDNANAIVAGVIASQQNGDNKALLQKYWAQLCADPKAPATVNLINGLKGDLVVDPLAGVTL